MSVPIIGAARIADWSITLLISCPCKATFMFTSKMDAVCVCGKCGRMFRLSPTTIMTPGGPVATLGLVNQDGNLDFTLGMKVPEGGPRDT